MTDLSHWDFLNQFTPKEAAALIAGVDPREAIGNSPIAIRIDEATVKAFIAVARGEPPPPDGLLTRELAITLHPDFVPSIFLDATGSTLHGIETLDRAEIVRWLSAIGAKSIYQFDLGSRLPIDAPPEQSPATPAPVVAVKPASDAMPDPERRLALLRALGGDAKYSRGDWTFKGISALVASEKGRKRSTEKTIREDLKEAVQNERDAGRAGFATGLGQR
jgi:hypothetical protein